MSLLRSKGHSFTESEEKSLDLLDAQAFMPADGDPSDPQVRSGLSAYQDARALVRLIQCGVCSKPLDTPVTLPCGHSLCRQCLPRPHFREGISYPATPDRQMGVTCPAKDCGREHAVGECNIDVTLTKVLESISDAVSRLRPDSDITTTYIEEIERPDESDSTVSREEQEIGSESEKPRSWTLHGGRLLATFELAARGELPYESDVTYQSLSTSRETYKELDEQILASIHEHAQKELDCHVCYNTMLDPVTTPCGHTFCRICLARVLDHAVHCPVCRRTLPIPPSLIQQPSNACLVNILNALCPEVVAARAKTVAAEEHGLSDEFNTAMFICTLSFPGMPTFLRIFEPRYRLMIRRALDSNRQFAMVMYNRSRAPQGDLGVTDFMHYGTMLEIVNAQMLPSGESLLETRGVYRFKVADHGVLDGYQVGRVDRVEDVSLAEEERAEAEETAAAQVALEELQREAQANGHTHPRIDPQVEINRMSTRELLLQALQFIERMRANSEPWLRQGILDAYGGPPDDPALFPYWFASILPISEEQKYLLLQTTSVRERLKIVIGWIRRIEGQRW